MKRGVRAVKQTHATLLRTTGARYAEHADKFYPIEKLGDFDSLIASIELESRHQDSS